MNADMKMQIILLENLNRHFDLLLISIVKREEMFNISKYAKY